nr:MAG TPA: hypothetical protein [Caudoviricetes sp.]
MPDLYGCCKDYKREYLSGVGRSDDDSHEKCR